MPLYEFECPECGKDKVWEIIIPLKDYDKIVFCPHHVLWRMKRLCRNNGGFRLSKKGAVGWAEDGYATHFGDAENFKAGHKIY